MLLIINAGSSSIKFVVYSYDGLLEKNSSGEINRIGQIGSKLTFGYSTVEGKQTIPLAVRDFSLTIAWLINWLEKQYDFTAFVAIGHRLVHGMKLTEPSVITTELLNELKEIAPYDTEHLPNEIQLIEKFKERQPNILQFACFDTAFHQSMPRVAQILPIPRRFDQLGVHRYGFHGISYSYLMLQLGKLQPKEVDKNCIVLTHLGSGASLAAVLDGTCIDTSMGFTPCSGLPMSSRSGDLDPGVVSFIQKHDNLSPEEFNHLINHQSGLLGISETSSDMTELLSQEASDIRSAEAVQLFCYQVKKWIGSFAAALGGIGTLVFAGGIGENAATIRTRICSGLGFLGIELDEERNAANEGIISTASGKVVVRIIRTDEEWMIAHIVSDLLKAGRH
jgi:acetate kinase